MDELRDDEGSLARRVLTNKWPKPESVRLFQKMVAPKPEQHTLADLIKPQAPVPHMALEFSWLTKEGLSIYPSRLVKPPATLLEQFMDLYEADDVKIQSFARKYGGLFVYCSSDRSEDGDRLTVTEFCEVWRYFAGSIRALLNIAATISKRKVGTAEDWERIGQYPPVMKEFQDESRFDIVSAELVGEEAWTVMARCVARGTDGDLDMWTSLLNALLDLGRVRAFVFLEGPLNNRTPSITFGTPSLLSHLAFHTCLLAVRRNGFAVCSYCRSLYLPRQRAPKTGQRNFCDQCKNKKVPARLSQRDRRARERGEKE